MKRTLIFASILISMFFVNVHAHDNGLVLNLKANFSGTVTMPSINQADLDTMGATYLEGGMNFVMDGEAEFGYIFGAEEYFNVSEDSTFSGMGAFITLGVGEGYAGQKSGTVASGQVVDLFMNVEYAPVISFSLGTKLYLFKNRMALGVNVGGKMIADISPSFESYTAQIVEGVDALLPTVGTIIVTEDMIKKMNPFMISVKASVEYYQPIVERMELILGGYASYSLFAPGYITMPSALADLAANNTPPFDAANTPLDSLRIDSLDFGLTLGLSFKV